MRLFVARLISLSLLSILPGLVAQAQDAPTVAITPEAGIAEQAVFEILISGLAPDSAYTIEIIFEGAVVFTSAETSSADGEIDYPISSTEGDAPGIYTLQVLSGAETVASADFELTAAETAAAAEREFLGDVTVSPETARFGMVQTIRIGELETRTEYTIEISASETLQVAYRRIHASDEDGVIEIEVFAEEDDSPGHHAIAVYNENGELIAEGEFTIEAPPERAVEVELQPAAIQPGQAVAIVVGGLAPFDSVTAQITTADGVLIDTVLARASSDGAVTLDFNATDGLAHGEYQVDVYVDGAKLAGAALAVGGGAAEELALELSVEPPSGEIGSEHLIAVNGLAAQQAFELVILDPAGEEEYRTSRFAGADGGFSLTISSAEEDEAGSYTVEIRAVDSNELLAQTSFEISAARPQSAEPAPAAIEAEPPARALATIEPQAAPIGSSHLITVSGLGVGEQVTFDVEFAGESVYQTQKTADAQGTVRLELVTDAEDATGDYLIRVQRAAGNQPTVILTATAKAAPELVATTLGAADVIEGSLIDGSAVFDFTGESGNYVLVTVASADFDPALALIDREDFEIAFNDDSRGRKDSTIGPMALPYSGRYTLEVSAQPLMMAQGAIDGDFVLSISEVSPAPLAFAAANSFALETNAPAQYFALPVETGDSLTATLNSDGDLDTLLQVVAPDGSEFAFDDDSGSGFDAELSNLVFDRAATYVLVVSSFDSGATGRGSLTIRHNPVHALEEGDALITLNDKLIRDLVVFDAVEDEYLILNLDKVSGDVEDLYVTATVEGMEVMSYSTMGVPDELPLAFVMPMSGRVVVTLEKFGFDDGISLEVSLERP